MIEVDFIVGGDKYTFGLAQALDAIANDIFWDERGDWRDSDRAEVRTI